MTLQQAVRAAERKVLKDALASSRTRTEAAMKLGITRQNLYHLAERVGVNLRQVQQNGNWYGL
jgi:DNA-binding NtrC family response regulator